MSREYTVVSETTTARLILEVRNLIADRWEPIGGVSVGLSHYVDGKLRDGDGSIDSSEETIFAQAMVRCA